ncbi:hypothetical protein KDL29_07230 [bacterium]|nr:hypothetical protein [bacterium]
MDALKQAAGRNGNGTAQPYMELEQQAAPPTGTTLDEAKLFSDDGADVLVRILLATGQRPSGGWHQAVGVTADELDSYARSPEIRRLRLQLRDSGVVTPAMLHAIYRQKLMRALLDSTDNASLNTIGKLVEKVPLEGGPALEAPAGEESLQSLELLLERLESSRELLAEGHPAASDADPIDIANTQTDTPQHDAADKAAAGRDFV